LSGLELFRGLAQAFCIYTGFRERAQAAVLRVDQLAVRNIGGQRGAEGERT
jgi:hypothetical protein